MRVGHHAPDGRERPTVRQVRRLQEREPEAGVCPSIGQGRFVNVKSLVGELAILAIAWAIGVGLYKGFVGCARPLTPLEWAGSIVLFVGVWAVLTLRSKK